MNTLPPEEEDPSSIPPAEAPLEESKEAQIDRMAGCARLGKMLLYAASAVLVILALYQCQQMR